MDIFIVGNVYKYYGEKMKIEIYGKENCSYCVQAKGLCEREGLDHTYSSLDEEYTFEEFAELFPKARTFPQITVNGNPIGGFTELKELVLGNIA
tara:strand:+ start:434 stop:715 length:282 start_codon:yes stop_codon:yes gene_type:complete